MPTIRSSAGWRKPTTATDTPDQAEVSPFDPAKAEAFSGHLMQILGGGLLSLMVDIGHCTGLFAAAADGWATSDQLAARAGLTAGSLTFPHLSLTRAWKSEAGQATGKSLHLPGSRRMHAAGPARSPDDDHPCPPVTEDHRLAALT